MDPYRRQARLEGLETAIFKSQEWMAKILGSLNWSKEHLMQKDEDLVPCPVNSSHRMPARYLKKHLQYCPLLEKGYTREELERSESTSFYYEKSRTVVPVTIDEATYHEIVSVVPADQPVKEDPEEIEMPLTMDRAMSELTPAQRLATYEYCVSTAQSLRGNVTVPLHELMMLEKTSKKEEQKPKSTLEILAEKRDMKRRRQSYRAKNVYTTKKSHSEIIREVIQNQMEALEERRQKNASVGPSSHDTEKWTRPLERDHMDRREFSFPRDGHERFAAPKDDYGGYSSHRSSYKPISLHLVKREGSDHRRESSRHRRSRSHDRHHRHRNYDDDDDEHHRRHRHKHKKHKHKRHKSKRKRTTKASDSSNTSSDSEEGDKKATGLPTPALQSRTEEVPPAPDQSSLYPGSEPNGLVTSAEQNKKEPIVESAEDGLVDGQKPTTLDTGCYSTEIIDQPSGQGLSSAQ